MTQPLILPLAKPTTAQPVNFGYDTSCVTGLRTGRFVSGPRLVAEAAYRRLSTPRGSLKGGEAEQDYGFDLTDLIGKMATPSQEAAVPGQIEQELLQDERIDSVDVPPIVSVKTGPSVAWTITINGQTALGPFQLVLGVTEVSVSILGLTAEG